MEEIRIYHTTNIIKGENVIKIFVIYPTEYEFALDFDVFKKNVNDLSKKIKEYLSKNIDTKKTATVLLVLNGLLIGSIITTNIADTNLQTGATQKYSSGVETTIGKLESGTPKEGVKLDSKTIENNNLVTEPEEDKDETPITVAQKIETNKSVPTTTTAITNQTQTVTRTTATPTAKATNTTTTTTTTIKPATTSVAPTTTPTTTTSTAPTTTTNVIQGETVNVKLKTGQIVTLSMNDYLIGVVSAEVPASFQSEALKAQTVAARTYTYKKLASGATTMVAGTENQDYKTEKELSTLWGTSYDTYYNKIKNVVLATNGQHLTYNNKYIDALFFSTSNGKTEDPIFVWGNSFAYLKSVDSKWDVGVSGFTATKTFSYSDLSSKLGVTLNSSSDIRVIDKTTGDRVKTATFDTKVLTGVKVRSLLGLRSADFDITLSPTSVTFTTRGYGHGVGMSQYGANGMAKAGYNYVQILKHYYTGVELKTK